MRKFFVSIAIATVAVGWSGGLAAATTYSYDTLGRLACVAYDNYIIIYNYDPAGNRTQVIVQSGTCPT